MNSAPPTSYYPDECATKLYEGSLGWRRARWIVGSSPDAGSEFAKNEGPQSLGL